MNKETTMKETIAKLALGAGGAATAAGVALCGAGRANADTHYIIADVDWTGPQCIEIQYPVYDTVISDVMCTPTRHWHAAYYAEPGEMIGFNPEIGSASFVSCTMTIDGRIDHAQSAFNGDGNVVDCLGTLTEETPLLQRAL
jgi:hypothetical protein